MVVLALAVLLLFVAQLRGRLEAILAAFTIAELRAANSTLVAFAVFFEAATLFAVAAFQMEALINFYFGLEGIRIAVQYCVKGHLSLLAILHIGAALAVAIRVASTSIREAIAV